MTLTTQILHDLILSVGTHRRNRKLSPVEVSNALQQVISEGGSVKKCSEITQLNATMVGNFLKLQRLAPAIKHLVTWGESNGVLSFSSACEVAKLPVNEHCNVADLIMRLCLKKQEVMQVVQLYQRSSRNLDDCVSAVIKIRSNIETRHVVIGSIYENNTQKIMKMLQADRDSILNKVLAPLLPTSGYYGKMGQDRFTVVIDDRCFNILNKIGFDALERNINSFIEDRVS